MQKNWIPTTNPSGRIINETEEREKRERREKNAIYSGHLRLCQQPRAAHALRSDQDWYIKIIGPNRVCALHCRWANVMAFYFLSLSLYVSISLCLSGLFTFLNPQSLSHRLTVVRQCEIQTDGLVNVPIFSLQSIAYTFSHACMQMKESFLYMSPDMPICK